MMTEFLSGSNNVFIDRQVFSTGKKKTKGTNGSRMRFVREVATLLNRVGGRTTETAVATFLTRTRRLGELHRSSLLFPVVATVGSRNYCDNCRFFRFRRAAPLTGSLTQSASAVLTNVPGATFFLLLVGVSPLFVSFTR